MTTRQQMTAKLVYDGGDQVYIPEELGTPREDQMQGTPAEQLTEIAGRSCYDSLGKGRPSFSRVDLDRATGTNKIIQGYHDHITEVGHGSVWEHFNFVVQFNQRLDDYLHEIVGRPGVWLEGRHRLTVNLRTINDWDLFKPRLSIGISNYLRDSLRRAGNKYAPNIVKAPSTSTTTMSFTLPHPETDEEKWVSMFLGGSRGFSHEQVRHGDFSAISQRSTRYVDESETAWIEHPLIQQFKQEHWGQDSSRPFEQGPMSEARHSYQQTVKTLQNWLQRKGVNKLTARKQARGAARGYLGNALYTEMIFSASAAQWKRMLRQRATVHADAEIRGIYEQVLSELKHSRYGDCFDNWHQRPSPDGIGLVAFEK